MRFEKFSSSAVWSLLLISVVCGLLMLYHLDGTPLRGRFDDDYRALIAKTMVDSGNWLVPQVGARPLYTKPPLMYWTAAALGRLTGRHDELPGNLTSALSLFVVVLCTWWLGRNLFGSAAGLRAGLILPTMYFFLAMSRQTLIDSVMMAGFAVCVGALVQLVRGQSRRRWPWWILATVGLGVTLMSKGPVVIPVLGLIAWPLLKGQRQSRPGYRLTALLSLLLLGMILPWPLAVLKTFPEARQVWMQELFGRLGSGPQVHPWTSRPLWYYIPDLVNTAPWIFLLPGALVMAWRKRSQRVWQILLWWVVGGFVIYSLASANKRSYFLLPLYPGFALVIAGAWQEWFGRDRPAGLMARLPLQMAAGAVALIGAALFALPFFHSGLPETAFRVGGLLGLLSGSAGLALWGRYGPDALFGGVVTGSAILYLAWFGHFIPVENAYASGKPFYAVAEPLIGDAELILVEVPVPLSLFYLPGHPYRNLPRSRMDEALVEGQKSVIVTTPAIAAEFPELVPLVVRTLRAPFHKDRCLGLYMLSTPLKKTVTN